ncbi:MAG TPA: SRPBCC family protein [Blastocatellia bacterium]|nr:SRPBCC family protein [Blastocatellia bacterium]
MKKVALQLEHSVEADVSPTFAWKFRTDVANWNDPPAKFALDGPFAVGSRGTTWLPGQDPIHWHIPEVRPEESFVIEMELDQATIAFEWRFEALSEHSTKLTHRLVLSGDNAMKYAEQVEAGFGSNLPNGLERIAAEMEAAARQEGAAG